MFHDTKMPRLILIKKSYGVILSSTETLENASSGALFVAKRNPLEIASVIESALPR